MIFIIVCVSWNNKKCFDTIDVRCKHEDSFLCVSGVTQYIVLTLFARLFVQYCSSSAMSHSFYHFSVVYNTMYEYWRRFMDFR